jgi:Holliday junction resolvase RusA-like endonuclease
MYEANKGHKAWRKTVTEAVRLEMANKGWEPFTKNAAVVCNISFYFSRPKTVTRKHHTVKPDTDKLCRSILDSLTDSGLLAGGDQQVTRLHASKEYGERDHIFICIWELLQDDKDTPNIAKAPKTVQY